MASSGLRDHGYAYMNIDGWWQMNNKRSDDPTVHGVERDPATGMINANSRFPDMPGFTDLCHKLGLKAGIYSGPGPVSCGGGVTSYQHEEVDAKRFADWGFDYLKYDFCSYGSAVPMPKRPPGITKEAWEPTVEAYHKKPYELMGRILLQAEAGHRSLACASMAWGMSGNGPTEIPGGNCWRTTEDIGGSWYSMAKIGFNQGGHEPYVKPGCWNDPDMMTVGFMGYRWTGLDDDEQYTEMSLWCILAAPLILGNDMTKIDEFTHNLLCNDEVIEVNQDPLGRMASCIATRGDAKVYAKEMSDGSHGGRVLQPRRRYACRSQRPGPN